MKCFAYLILFFALTGPCIVQAQTPLPSRAELEKRRNQLQQDIEQATQDLNGVQQNRQQTMLQVQLLENKIRLRNKLITNINDEIHYIDQDIRSANHDIVSMQKDLDTLRAQYARLVVYAYKSRSAYDFLNFILSANSFNDAIKRFQYLKQYREYRAHQASSIISTQQLLKQKISNLQQMKLTRRGVLSSQEVERKSLVGEEDQKRQMVQQLKGHEKELMAQINAKKRESRELSIRIAAVIRREIEEARKRAAAEAAAKAAKAKAEQEAREKALAASGGTKSGAAPAPAATHATSPAASSASKTSRPANVLEDTPESLALSENFESNKGKLPWPVTKAIILDPFGVHQHPVFDKITVDNDGISIGTSTGAEVHAVFDGEVASIFPLSGKWIVMIKHGQYFTVYANLKDVSVQRGQEVKTLQAIGTVSTSSTEGTSELDFKIYKGNEPVNPELWLKHL